MSKIEEALARFRAEQGNAGTTVTRQAPDERVPSRQGQGEIARMDPVRRWTRDELEAKGLIDFTSSDRRVVNAFRQLRTALLQRAAPPNFVMAVTGVSVKSGTSFVARNLAAAFALDPTKTALLVDCNLMATDSPQLALEADPDGLVDYLMSRDMDVEDIIHSTGLPRLRVVPSGRHNVFGDELFTTPRLHELLAQFRQRYPDRFILLDTPPIAENADSRILAELCDYVLLVIPYGRVSEAQVNEALDTIGPERIIGAVFDDDPVWPY